MILRLSEVDSDEAREVTDRLRMLLSQWLTVPVPFDGALLESISALGDADALESRWGRDLRLAYDLARVAAGDLQNTENPIRAALRELILHLRREGRAWRIYCHRQARIHFESIFREEPLAADGFLHSVRDYRETEPFDVLMKVGPLRSRGWGSAPDALISAPRFGKLVQIVWSGSSDEDDFGYDPVAPPTGVVTPGFSRGAATTSWTRQVVQQGYDAGPTGGLPEFDELKFFQESPRVDTLRRATLIEIDEEHGILYPPHSKVASFDLESNSESAIAYRLPETLSEGMFVILPLLGNADLGALQAADGHFSQVWKRRLRDELRRSRVELVERLRAAGLDLLHLASRVRWWWRPASTVIPAPQQKKHFEILISVLGIDHEGTPSPMHRRPWWQYAWNEIAQSRGEAIQTGKQEHEIVDEELFTVLAELLPTIRRTAQTRVSFQIDIPAGKSLEGTVHFCQVRSIEEGFLVPDHALGTICDLGTVEQWRA